MKSRVHIKLTLYLFGFAGAPLFTALLIRQGAADVGRAVATACWALLAIAIYHLLVPVFLDAVAWWVLFPKPERPRLRQLFWMRWVGESISTRSEERRVGKECRSRGSPDH